MECLCWYKHFISLFAWHLCQSHWVIIEKQGEEGFIKYTQYREQMHVGCLLWVWISVSYVLCCLPSGPVDNLVLIIFVWSVFDNWVLNDLLPFYRFWRDAQSKLVGIGHWIYWTPSARQVPHVSIIRHIWHTTFNIDPGIVVKTILNFNNWLEYI